MRPQTQHNNFKVTHQSLISTPCIPCLIRNTHRSTAHPNAHLATACECSRCSGKFPYRNGMFKEGFSFASGGMESFWISEKITARGRETILHVVHDNRGFLDAEIDAFRSSRQIDRCSHPSAPSQSFTNPVCSLYWIPSAGNSQQR